jgi:hypothetical protein
MPLPRIDRIRRTDRNDTVRQPITRRAEYDAPRPYGQREDLADDDPCARSPRGREENVDTDEGDLDAHRVQVSVVARRGAVIATRNSQVSIPTALQMSSGRRPTSSMAQKLTGGLQTLTRVVISQMRKGLVIVPRFLKEVLK